MSKFTDKPTAEWDRHNAGNIQWSGMGRGEAPHLRRKYRDKFDILIDMDEAEFAPREFAVGRFRAAAEGFDVFCKANGGRLGDAPSGGGVEDMATIYNAITRHVIRPQVATCRMLVEPFYGDGQAVRSTRHYLFAQMQDITRALANLEEALKKINEGDYGRPEIPLAFIHVF